MLLSQRQLMCSGKQQFGTYAEATAAIERMRRHGAKTNRAGRFDAYRCPFCQDYHIGNRNKQQRRQPDKAPKRSNAELRRAVADESE